MVDDRPDHERTATTEDLPDGGPPTVAARPAARQGRPSEGPPTNVDPDPPRGSVPLPPQIDVPVPPGAPRSRSSTSMPTTESRSAGSSTNVASPIEALARDELTRTRMFCAVGIVVAVGAASTLPFLPGGYVTTRLFLGSIIVAAIGMAYLLHRTRTPETFHQGYGVAIGWYIPAVAVNSAIPYFGPFSPVSIVLVLGIYFTGLGSSRALATAIYVTCAAAQAATGIVVIAGIANPGFIRADDLTPTVQALCQGLIQLVFASTFFVARASRKSSLMAISELDRAVRGIGQREALLQEARDELQRALGAGRGRFTEQTIGSFRLGELIGRGAMGEVYEAVDVRNTQTVAVKMLASMSLGNPHHVQRFLRELRTASTIDSAHVVKVIDIGEQPLPHLVMERLYGRDLAAMLREKPMPHPAVVELIRQVGAGITAAGAAGVIHRDLKPQNVFLAGATWKILDFGVSRQADTGDTLTAGHVVGTPAYMAPEQARGDTVDHRADLYSLAAIAYRALTGHAPFIGKELAETLYRVVHTAPRRPSALVPVPPELDLVLAVGLAKEPDDRFATAAELADGLAQALEGQLDEPLRARGRRLVAAGAWVRGLPARRDS